MLRHIAPLTVTDHYSFSPFNIPPLFEARENFVGVKKREERRKKERRRERKEERGGGGGGRLEGLDDDGSARNRVSRASSNFPSYRINSSTDDPGRLSSNVISLKKRGYRKLCV